MKGDKPAEDPDSPNALRNKGWAFSELFWEGCKRMALTAAVAVVADETKSAALMGFAGVMLVMVWFWGAQAIQRMFFPGRPYVDLESRRGCLMYVLMLGLIVVLLGGSVPIVELLAKGVQVGEAP